MKMISFSRKILRVPVVAILMVVFSFSSVGAAVQSTSVSPSVALMPVSLLGGFKLNSQDPFQIDFLFETPEGSTLNDQDVALMVKYFLASLAVPEKDLWVNLSPGEPNRITSEALSKTDLGRDLLSQDFILKQTSTKFLSPEHDIGKNVWEFLQKSGVSDVSMDFLQRIWIVPQSADLYQKDLSVWINDARMTVKIENLGQSSATDKILRDIFVPAIEREVNEGEAFAPLRQMYRAMILAAWYKRQLKSSLMKSYIDQKNLGGLQMSDERAVEAVYQQYLQAFQQGNFSQIQEDYNPETQMIEAKHYVTGGFDYADSAQMVRMSAVPQFRNPVTAASVRLQDLAGNGDKAMMADMTGHVEGVLSILKRLEEKVERKEVLNIQEKVTMRSKSLYHIQQIISLYAEGFVCDPYLMSVLDAMIQDAPWADVMFPQLHNFLLINLNDLIRDHQRRTGVLDILRSRILRLDAAADQDPQSVLGKVLGDILSDLDAETLLLWDEHELAREWHVVLGMIEDSESRKEWLMRLARVLEKRLGQAGVVTEGFWEWNGSALDLHALFVLFLQYLESPAYHPYKEIVVLYASIFGEEFQRYEFDVPFDFGDFRPFGDQKALFGDLRIDMMRIANMRIVLRNFMEDWHQRKLTENEIWLIKTYRTAKGIFGGYLRGEESIWRVFARERSEFFGDEIAAHAALADFVAFAVSYRHGLSVIEGEWVSQGIIEEALRNTKITGQTYALLKTYNPQLDFEAIKPILTEAKGQFDLLWFIYLSLKRALEKADPEKNFYIYGDGIEFSDGNSQNDHLAIRLTMEEGRMVLTLIDFEAMDVFYAIQEEALKAGIDFYEDDGLNGSLNMEIFNYLVGTWTMSGEEFLELLKRRGIPLTKMTRMTLGMGSGFVQQGHFVSLDDPDNPAVLMLEQEYGVEHYRLSDIKDIIVQNVNRAMMFELQSLLKDGKLFYGVKDSEARHWVNYWYETGQLTFTWDDAERYTARTNAAIFFNLSRGFPMLSDRFYSDSVMAHIQMNDFKAFLFGSYQGKALEWGESFLKNVWLRRLGGVRRSVSSVEKSKMMQSMAWSYRFIPDVRERLEILNEFFSVLRQQKGVAQSRFFDGILSSEGLRQFEQLSSVMDAIVGFVRNAESHPSLKSLMMSLYEMIRAEYVLQGRIGDFTWDQEMSVFISKYGDFLNIDPDEDARTRKRNMQTAKVIAAPFALIRHASYQQWTDSKIKEVERFWRDLQEGRGLSDAEDVFISYAQRQRNVTREFIDGKMDILRAVLLSVEAGGSKDLRIALKTLIQADLQERYDVYFDGRAFQGSPFQDVLRQNFVQYLEGVLLNNFHLDENVLREAYRRAIQIWDQFEYLHFVMQIASHWGRLMGATFMLNSQYGLVEKEIVNRPDIQGRRVLGYEEQEDYFKFTVGSDFMDSALKEFIEQQWTTLGRSVISLNDAEFLVAKPKFSGDDFSARRSLDAAMMATLFESEDVPRQLFERLQDLARLVPEDDLESEEMTIEDFFETPMAVELVEDIKSLTVELAEKYEIQQVDLNYDSLVELSRMMRHEILGHHIELEDHLWSYLSVLMRDFEKQNMVLNIMKQALLSNEGVLKTMGDKDILKVLAREIARDFNDVSKDVFDQLADVQALKIIMERLDEPEFSRTIMSSTVGILRDRLRAIIQDGDLLERLERLDYVIEDEESLKAWAEFMPSFLLMEQDGPFSDIAAVWTDIFFNELWVVDAESAQVIRESRISNTADWLGEVPGFQRSRHAQLLRNLDLWGAAVSMDWRYMVNKEITEFLSQWRSGDYDGQRLQDLEIYRKVDKAYRLYRSGELNIWQAVIRLKEQAVLEDRDFRALVAGLISDQMVRRYSLPVQFLGDDSSDFLYQFLFKALSFVEKDDLEMLFKQEKAFNTPRWRNIFEESAVEFNKAWMIYLAFEQMAQSLDEGESIEWTQEGFVLGEPVDGASSSRLVMAVQVKNGEIVFELKDGLGFLDDVSDVLRQEDILFQRDDLSIRVLIDQMKFKYNGERVYGLEDFLSAIELQDVKSGETRIRLNFRNGAFEKGVFTRLDRGIDPQWVILDVNNPYRLSEIESFVIGDAAMITEKEEYGGINFDSGLVDWNIQGSADAALLWADIAWPDNFSGFSPVILNIQNVVNPQAYFHTSLN